jgi:mannose-6-phosphate isomerase-like protein (cupin superfamily)
MRIIDSQLDIHKRIIPKKWGSEVIVHNDDEFCGKILRLNKGAKFSMHFHIKKKETWYVTSGTFLLTYIDTRDATEKERELNVGDIIEIERGDPHQLFCFTGGEIFEVSTRHFDDDSYRIKKGDSQR